MWNINYSYLFNLRLYHDYYVDNKAKGLKLVPTNKTLLTLKNGNMLLKEIPYGVTVLYRADNDEVTPFIPFTTDLKLTFALKAEESARFFTITDLDVSPSEKYESGKLLFFQNSPASVSTDPEKPEEISHVLLDGLRGSLFTYEFGITGSPAEVLLRVRNSNNEVISVAVDGNGDPLPGTVQLQVDDVSAIHRSQRKVNRAISFYGTKSCR